MLKKIISALRNRKLPAELRRDLTSPRSWKETLEKRAADGEAFQRQIGNAIGINPGVSIGFDPETLAGSSKDDGRVIERWKRSPDGEVVTFRHDRLTDGPWPPGSQSKSRLILHPVSEHE